VGRPPRLGPGKREEAGSVPWREDLKQMNHRYGGGSIGSTQWYNNNSLFIPGLVIYVGIVYYDP
jgi:hypothetical protein